MLVSDFHVSGLRGSVWILFRNVKEEWLEKESEKNRQAGLGLVGALESLGKYTFSVPFEKPCGTEALFWIWASSGL